jgi:multidrug efflux pump subunit AcrB
MNIAEYAIKKRTVTLIFTLFVIVAGYFSYENLGRLEDPEFTVKDALIITYYPGASAQEVAEEVSDKIETKIQELGEVKEVQALNKRGTSVITVTMKNKYGKKDLPLIWQKLRSKIDDVIPQLPPGVSKPIVNDDFGDVYGTLYAVTGEGFSYKELYDYAKFLRKQLLLVKDVAKIDIQGQQPETIYIELNRDKIATLGIGLDEIFDSLNNKNTLIPAGKVKVGPDYITINPTGKVDAVNDIKNLVIESKDHDNKSSRLIYLKDIAKVYRGYQEPASKYIEFNGVKAVTLGISTVQGGNVVKMGEAVEAKLHQLQAEIPVGIELHPISLQSDRVTASINAFMVNLMEAVVIVIAVLMIFMGFRSASIIGTALFVTVMATFIIMKMQGIMLERISLGALIIALGMLVDNAIVVIDGMLVRIQKGMDRVKAAGEVVSQSFWPLLGATVIAVLAFGAIGLSQDSTGEYTRSLFYVILYSLLLSWLVAITVVPLLGVMFIKVKAGEENKDPFDNKFYHGLKSILIVLIRRRWMTVMVMIGLLALSFLAFSNLKNSFFPSSTRDQFMFHLYFAEDTDISQVKKITDQIEKVIKKDNKVKDVTSFIDSGAPRFLLTYTPEKDPSGYGFLVITVKDYHDIPELMAKFRQYVIDHYPSVLPRPEQFALGPTNPAVEAVIYGPNPDVLRHIGEEIKTIMREKGGTAIRSEWRERVKEVVPIFDEARASEVGVTREDFNKSLDLNFDGLTVGYYREQDEMIPMVTRASEQDRLDVSQINNIQVWSSGARKYVPINQVIKKIEVKFVDAASHTKNRMRKFKVMCDPAIGALKSSIFERVKAPIEALKLPDGYRLEWEGEYKSSNDAKESLMASIPMFVVMMVLIVVMLFNSVKEPIIIWLTVPLALVGVGFGLYTADKPFDFMALLGFLSLTGMLIKNSIVLIDEINLELSNGREKFDAVIHSVLSRTRPVSMGALTTVLGMIPLLTDAFFVAMAVAIMAGLAFATVLTLLFVPVLYAIFHKVQVPENLSKG